MAAFRFPEYVDIPLLLRRNYLKIPQIYTPPIFHSLVAIFNYYWNKQTTITVKVIQISINDGKWLTVRDFMENETGCTLAKYEAKFVEDGEMEYIDKEIVLVKKTNSFGGEKMYFVPKEVIETVPHLLPQLTYLGMRALVIEIHRGNQQLKS